MSLTRRLVFAIFVFIALSFCSKGFAFEFSGFSDISMTQSEEGGESENRPFAIGQVDFYTSHNISDDLEILIEFVIESDAGEWVVDLERIQIGYYFSDQLTIRAGRFHNTIGYWNPTYHHGALLHTTISRPEFLEFEDDSGILPTHTVGLWGHGSFDQSIGFITYDIMVGNGSRLVVDEGGIEPAILDPNNTSDDNKNKSITLNLQYEPVNILGSGFGIFTQISTVNSSDLSVEVDQVIYGADVFIDYEGMEFISEIYSINNKDQLADTGDTSGMGAYIQAGYAVGSFTPYARYEELSVDDDDPYFNALGAEDNNRTIIGLNYDFQGRSKLKGEVRFIDMEERNDKTTEYALQWAFLF